MFNRKFKEACVGLAAEEQGKERRESRSEMVEKETSYLQLFFSFIFFFCQSYLNYLIISCGA